MQDTPPLENKELAPDSQPDTIAEGSSTKDSDYLILARTAYRESTDYYNGSLRRQWERNIANFMSYHPGGSKYRSPTYLNRSKIFKPKTRSAIRSNEAAAVAAFFSTKDVVSIAAEDTNNKEATMSADLLMELINYRLTGSSIPWFKIVIGSFQDAQVMGTCIANVEWNFKERETGQEQFVGTDEDGELIFEPIMEVVKDTPEIRLVPNENLRVDPGTNWMNPVESSPYIIELIPMHIKDVRAKMESTDSKTGEPVWYPLSDEQLLSAISSNNNDSTRLQREQGRQDPTDQPSSITGHTMVWVHRNIMELDGVDYLWYTLATHHLLSDPVPLSEVVLHGMRPYVIGHSVIEAHRFHPSGLVELGQELQAASNENFNQRFDNIKLGLNSRSFVRRAASVDLRALKRSVPGGLVMVGNVDKDVKPIEVKDVTRSSYEDQDRINNDFDEVMGSFSQSSVNSNRKLGETVGGMGMIKDNANIMTEYVIRTYGETFVEDVVRHLVALEREYETDQNVLRIAADRARIPEGTMITPEMLNHAVEVSVDVGYGATDPVRKIQKFSLALNSVAVIPGLLGRLKEEAVVSEVFGNAGYANGDKFFEGLGEEQQPQGPSLEQQIEMKKLEQQDVKLQLEQFKIQRAADSKENDIMVKRELGYAKLAFEKDIKLEALYRDLGVKAGELDLKHKSHDLAIIKEMGRREEREIDRREMNYKETTGKPGM
jgi:hypothetical protein